MPLLFFTSTTSPTHEPIDVRVKDQIFTCVMNTTADLYVDHEKVAALTTALQALDAGVTVHTRSE